MGGKPRTRYSEIELEDALRGWSKCQDEVARLRRELLRLSPLLDAATKECISARLRGLSKEYIQKFWRAFIPQTVDEFTTDLLPAIRNTLKSLENQQRGSIFDLKHEDPCGFGHE